MVALAKVAARPILPVVLGLAASLFAACGGNADVLVTGSDASPLGDGSTSAADVGDTFPSPPPDAPEDGPSARADAAATSTDASDSPDPLAPCSVARDVFYVGAGVPSDLPRLKIVTNLDANWSASAWPLSVSAGTTGLAGGGVVSITTPDNVPLAPGTYAEPVTTTTPRPYLNVTAGGIDWTSSGAASGSFTVTYALANDGDAGADAEGQADASVQSVLLSYSLQVPLSAGGTSALAGCVRFTADAPPSTGTSLLSSAASGAALLAPCSGGGDFLYVEGEGGYPGFAGPLAVSPASGTFGVSLFGSAVELEVESGSTTWQIDEGAGINATAPLPPGTYTPGSGANAPTIQVSGTGPGCLQGSAGTFGIVSIQSDSNAVTQLSTWFDLQCGPGQSLRGCAVYGN